MRKTSTLINISLCVSGLILSASALGGQNAGVGFSFRGDSGAILSQLPFSAVNTISSSQNIALQDFKNGL